MNSKKQNLEEAMELLCNTDKKINEIALEVGFAYESSFIRSFKQEFGITPGKARKRNQREKQ